MTYVDRRAPAWFTEWFEGEAERFQREMMLFGTSTVHIPGDPDEMAVRHVEGSTDSYGRSTTATILRALEQINEMTQESEWQGDIPHEMQVTAVARIARDEEPRRAWLMEMMLDTASNVRLMGCLLSERPGAGPTDRMETIQDLVNHHVDIVADHGNEVPDEFRGYTSGPREPRGNATVEEYDRALALRTVDGEYQRCMGERLDAIAASFGIPEGMMRNDAYMSEMRWHRTATRIPDTRFDHIPFMPITRLDREESFSVQLTMANPSDPSGMIAIDVAQSIGRVQEFNREMDRAVKHLRGLYEELMPDECPDHASMSPEGVRSVKTHRDGTLHVRVAEGMRPLAPTSEGTFTSLRIGSYWISDATHPALFNVLNGDTTHSLTYRSTYLTVEDPDDALGNLRMTVSRPVAALFSRRSAERLDQDDEMQGMRTTMHAAIRIKQRDADAVLMSTANHVETEYRFIDGRMMIGGTRNPPDSRLYPQRDHLGGDRLRESAPEPMGPQLTLAQFNEQADELLARHRRIEAEIDNEVDDFTYVGGALDEVGGLHVSMEYHGCDIDSEQRSEREPYEEYDSSEYVPDFAAETAVEPSGRPQPSALDRSRVSARRRDGEWLGSFSGTNEVIRRRSQPPENAVRDRIGRLRADQCVVSPPFPDEDDEGEVPPVTGGE